MKKYAVLCVLATSLGGFAMAEELTGVISDSNCAAKHGTVSEANEKCVEGCLKKGASPVLVSGDKVYKLAGETDAAKSLAGKSVTVDGTVSGDTVTVAKISAAK